MNKPKKPKRDYGGVSRQAVWARTERIKRKQSGICPDCGNEMRGFNQKTGKPYYRGPKCRARMRELMRPIMKMKMRLRRAANS